MPMIDPIEISDPDIDQSPFEIEVLAARYRAERDLAIQARERLEKEVGILRDAEHERDMLRSLADVLVVKAIEHPTGRTFAEGLDDAEIDDCIDSIIEAIDRRLMPPGMEWPRYDTGEPVYFGDEVARDDGVGAIVDKIVFYGDQWRLFDRYGCEINEDMMEPGERVKHPDSWEWLRYDCSLSDVDYCAKYGLLDPSCDAAEGEGSTRHCADCGCTCGEKMALDLVRRAELLAERGR